MKMVVVIKVVICLFSLLVSDLQLQHNALAAAGKQYYSGEMKSRDQNWKMGRRVVGKQETSSWWLSEDYSVPRRRRPVHNNLQP